MAAGMDKSGAPGAPTLSQPASSKKTAQRGRKDRIALKEAKEVNELQIFS
jgi:hypothetical protein